MFKGIDHVVVAVWDIEAAVSRYETIYRNSHSAMRWVFNRLHS